MYGVVAGQGNEARRPHRHRDREQASEGRSEGRREENARGIQHKIFAYLKKQFKAQQEEEHPERIGRSVAARLELAALERETNFTRKEIKLMYRGFKQECPTGEVDEDSFKNIFSQFFPLGDASQYAGLVFNTIKDKGSDKLSFEQFLSALSVWGRGSRGEKMSSVFSMYDSDGDGRVSRGELLTVVSAVHALLGPHTAHSAQEHVDNIFPLMDADRDGVVSREELCEWVSRQPGLLRSLDHTDTVL